MDGKVEKSRSRGLPLPQWQDERAFLADARANPAIAWPMHLFDCSPISDGAACLLLVGEELARSFTDDPLHVAGIGQASGRSLSQADDLTS